MTIKSLQYQYVIQNCYVNTVCCSQLYECNASYRQSKLDEILTTIITKIIEKFDRIRAAYTGY